MWTSQPSGRWWTQYAQAIRVKESPPACKRSRSSASRITRDIPTISSGSAYEFTTEKHRTDSLGNDSAMSMSCSTMDGSQSGLAIRGSPLPQVGPWLYFPPSEAVLTMCLGPTMGLVKFSWRSRVMSDLSWCFLLVFRPRTRAPISRLGQCRQVQSQLPP